MVLSGSWSDYNYFLLNTPDLQHFNTWFVVLSGSGMEGVNQNSPNVVWQYIETIIKGQETINHSAVMILSFICVSHISNISER